MADSRSTAAEIRRGKKKKKIEGRRKETTGQKYNGPPITQGGHNKFMSFYHDNVGAFNINSWAKAHIRRG